MADHGKSQRRLVARIGGLSLHVRHDSDDIARKARAGFDAKFYVEANALNPGMSEAELEKTVERLRSLYFARLALKSMKTREQKKNRHDGQNGQNQ
jgi:hypothetical protein